MLWCVSFDMTSRDLTKTLGRTRSRSSVADTVSSAKGQVAFNRPTLAGMFAPPRTWICEVGSLRICSAVGSFRLTETTSTCC